MTSGLLAVVHRVRFCFLPWVPSSFLASLASGEPMDPEPKWVTVKTSRVFAIQKPHPPSLHIICPTPKTKPGPPKNERRIQWLIPLNIGSDQPGFHTKRPPSLGLHPKKVCLSPQPPPPERSRFERRLFWGPLIWRPISKGTYNMSHVGNFSHQWTDRTMSHKPFEDLIGQNSGRIGASGCLLASFFVECVSSQQLVPVILARGKSSIWSSAETGIVRQPASTTFECPF